MKTLFLLVLITTISTFSNAQIQKIDLQATGLTCSMCNKSIYKSLKTIENIDTIIPDLNTNIFTLTFKDATKIDIDVLKKKVEVAGYKIGKLWVYANFKETAIKNDTHTEMNGTFFHFMNVKESTINGVQKLWLVDKGYISSKQQKVWSKNTTMKCYNTGYMESCCNKDAKPNQRIYHVTI